MILLTNHKYEIIMIQSHVKYALFALFITLCASHTHTADNRPDIPSHVMEYLKEHTVDQELEHKLDQVFLQPEVYRSLARFYTGQTSRRSKMLEKKFKFSFYDYNKPHIFSSPNLPQFVLKIGQIDGSYDELKNIDRIRMAHYVNAVAQEHGLPLEAPTKKAYFLPHAMTIDGTTHYGPRVIVVADRKTGTKKWKEDEYELSYETLRNLGIADGHTDNFLSSQGNPNFILIDTEPRGKIEQALYLPLRIIPSKL
jgi:hypothetical protein